MRSVSYVLIALVTAFVVNTAASFVFPTYRTFLRDTRAHILGEKSTAETASGIADTQKQLTDSLSRIDASIQMLATGSGAAKVENTGSVVSTGVEANTLMSTGSTVAETKTSTGKLFSLSSLGIATTPPAPVVPAEP